MLTTARELLTNVVKHADARLVRVALVATVDTARMVISDDGRGMADVDLQARLGAGHLGLASRRIRVEAAGGTIDFRAAEPHGTVVEIDLPLTDVSG